MWHGRYYEDVPNQEERKRVSVPLGSIDSMTKSEAKRKLRTTLEELGVNTEDHLTRATCTPRTFAQDAAWWKEIRLVLLKPSTQENMGSHVDKYLVPRFLGLQIEAIDERQVQAFIVQLSRTEYVSPS